MKINSTIRENDPQATREPTSIFLNAEREKFILLLGRKTRIYEIMRRSG